jgi:hypothetical protein
MTTLTETAIELADCHTTLYYLGAKAPQPATLPLGTEEDYNAFYKKVATPARVTYEDISGQAGTILGKLSVVYKKNTYWNSFFGTGQLEAYPGLAWKFILPVSCSLKARITFIPDARFKFKVRLIPRALVYPCGWSTWVSLLLNGPHTLEDLAAFNQQLFDGKPFRLDRDPALAPLPPSSYSLSQLFEHVADGVRKDVFGAIKAKDFAPRDAVVVTTVRAKHGGILSIDGLNKDQEGQLLRIVKPDGPPLQGAAKDYAYRFERNSSLKYMVIDNYGRFTWMDDLLQPVDRNYQHLCCYHNNTFFSLVQARHLYQLLTQAARLKTLSNPLAELTDMADENLSSPSYYYENASLRAFLRATAVADARKKMEKFDPKPASPP